MNEKFKTSLKILVELAYRVLDTQFCIYKSLYKETSMLNYKKNICLKLYIGTIIGTLEL